MFAEIMTSFQRFILRPRVAASATFVIAAILATPAVRAQAVYTADRVDGFSVFGGYSYLNTDYGVNDKGYIVGADYTHTIRSRFITPSLEVRYTGSTGPAITESSFAGGLKVETHFHRVHPYAAFLIGYGIINYVPFNANDNSIIYGAAVGADINVTHQFAIKVDAQEQFWKLGQASSELTPESVSFGVLYRIPAGWGHKH